MARTKTKSRYCILYKDPKEPDNDSYREIHVYAADASAAIEAHCKKFCARKGSPELKTDDIHCFKVREPKAGRPPKKNKTI